MSLEFEGERSEEFNSRLSLYYDELKGLYTELYGDNKACFDEFIAMLNEYYCERNDDLREWDEAKIINPDWYAGNDILGMMMYVNCFADNLKGLMKHLDYIEACGVNYLHLMPLLKSPRGRSDGGYAVSDFRAVQPRLGKMKELFNLAKMCHDKGISLCLDFVMNHTSEEHEWAKRARAGEKEFQDKYFFYDNWDIPNQFEQTMPQVFPTTAPGNFTYLEDINKIVMTTFYPYQWDLNYANPKVFCDMTANMLYLCNQGIDIIRLDAVPYIWKALNTNCRNLPEVHKLVRIMRIACSIVCPGVLLLGEVVMEPSKVTPYFGSVEYPECHMLYNVTTMASTWHTVAVKDTRLLRSQLDKVFNLPKEYVFLNYLRCHDDIGWGLDYDYLRQFGFDEADHKKFLNDYFRGLVFNSDSRGELYNDDERLRDARLCGTTASLCGLEVNNKEALNLDITLHAFLLTQSGIPVIYSGDEIGQLNNYAYHDNLNPEISEDSRYLHRGNFDWKAAAKRGKNRLFTAIMHLTKIRAEHEVFCNKADTWTIDTNNNNILGIGRYYKDAKLIALFNFSREEQVIYLDANQLDFSENYINLFNQAYRNRKYKLTRSDLEQGIKLDPCGFVWLLAER
ncbi:MAG: alpha-amylase family protein [Synergistaceae bacterium]|nr:alpha-amylase family protein [Synergistaceae bacterium]